MAQIIKDKAGNWEKEVIADNGRFYVTRFKSFMLPESTYFVEDRNTIDCITGMPKIVISTQNKEIAMHYFSAKEMQK